MLQSAPRNSQCCKCLIESRPISHINMRETSKRQSIKNTQTRTNMVNRRKNLLS